MGVNVLILGGTRDAYKLAERLHAKGIAVTTALAGVTRNPRQPAGLFRSGGFGGADGLAAYLQANRITHLVDATHPYAATISANAVGAAEQTGLPLVRLTRSAWTPPSGADWRAFENLEDALRALPEGAHVFATIGSKQLATLLQWKAGRLFIRMLEEPDGERPAHAQILTGRPPFTVESESALLHQYGVTHLLTKNSGGAASWSKIAAASEMGLRIFVLRRPQLPPAREVTDLEAVEAFIHSVSP